MFALRTVRQFGRVLSRRWNCEIADRSCSRFTFESRLLNKLDFNERVDGPDPRDLRAVGDPDTFGTMGATSTSHHDDLGDEGDAEEEEFLSEHRHKRRKLSTKQYADLIKDHLAKRRLKEAIDVLEVRMLKEDCAHAENYIYNLLVDGCAEEGYAEKAFKLFNDMKRRGLKPTGATYNSLFKACAASPYPRDGLKRAIKLRQLMQEKLVEPNLQIFNCMIKAFGRCGDIQGAFAIVDEMRSKGIKIRVQTFCFMLQACITDKTYGFRHALIVWRKMLAARERPSIYCFNLMLKCARECGLGVDDFKSIAGDMAPQIPSGVPARNPSEETAPRSVEPTADGPEGLVPIDTLPNLLARVPHMGSVTSVAAVSAPEDRLTLMGGVEGFLDELARCRNAPDIKTFTQLLHIAPNTREVDETIMRRLGEADVKPDIDFFNMLIKRRCWRLDYESAKDVRSMINQENKKIKSKLRWFPKKKDLIRPDIITYGVWALCCDTQQGAVDLLEEMKVNRLRINIEIAGTFLHAGVCKLDIDYILFTMKLVVEERILVNNLFLQHLNKFHHKCKRLIDQQDTSTGENFSEKYENYKIYYSTWINDITKETDEESEHPWQQFKTNQPITFQKPYEKPKKIRYYKKKGKIFRPYRVRA